MEGEDEAEGGDRGREKKEDGEKRKKEREGKGKSREREGETWPLSSKTSWTMEKTNLQTNDQGEVCCLLRYRTKKTECLRPRQVKQYFREAVSQEQVLKDGEGFSRNLDVISRGRQQHLEKSRVMKTMWGC